jgi:site-specific DNA-methyltransferase (adenine-specific)
MTPYYADDLVTIYHGDCREWMPAADVVVTDPPYGLGFRDQAWDEAVPDWLGLARQRAPLVMFTAPPVEAWEYPKPTWVLCWARPASNARSLAGGFNHWSPVLVYGQAKFPVDLISLHAIANATERWVEHPSPKPVALLRWLIANGSVEGDVVLDPFMGSGSTLVAAKSLGRRAIGIEIEEKYCEIAAQRCSQEVLGLTTETPRGDQPSGVPNAPSLAVSLTALGSHRGDLSARSGDSTSDDLSQETVEDFRRRFIAMEQDLLDAANL